MNTAAVEEQDLEMSSDEAVISALTPKQLEDGLELEPFSVMRQAVAMNLCGPGGANFFNMVMTVWPCTLSETEVLMANRDLEKAQTAAFKWAESRGYSLANIDPLVEVYRGLNAELNAASRAQVRDGDGDVPKNAGGQRT
jgi:hypothetical protein